MQQIADWLEKLGMSDYAQRFVENDIDLSILPDLTDQDLRELGLSMGHRRRLLRAISELNNTRPSSSDIAKSAPPPISVSEPSLRGAATAVPIGEALGERRHVTVRFCDLVDSTGIAAKLDAEEWRDLVGAYLDAATAAVTEMGGKVAKKLGDGLMALFRYPVAQENDAERAVRAARAIQRALAELNRNNAGVGKPALAARIASLLLRHSASFEESWQVVRSPCYPRELPDVISENLSLDAGSRTPAVHRVPSPVSSTMSSAFPKQRMGRLPAFCPTNYDFSQVRVSRMQIFLYVPASKFALPPDRSYRCDYYRRAAGDFTSGPIVLCCLHTHRIC
jgi:hypothetical protein